LSLTANVAAVGQTSATPAGSIQFVIDGSKYGGSVVLDAGSASIAVALGAGLHTIEAVYSSSDSNFLAGAYAGGLTVGKAHLTVTADSKSVLYGAPVPTLTATITGFVHGEDASVLSGKPILATTFAAANGVGTYPIRVDAGALIAPNYDFPSLIAGTLIVTPVPLTIQADSKSRAFGQPNPELTVSYSGFVNGDGPSSLSSPVVASTMVTAESPPGVYPITVGGAASPYYSITFVGGTLTVIAPPLVTMSNVHEIFNKKHQVTRIVVDFSGPVNAGQADVLATYRLTASGKHGSFTAKNAKRVSLKSAVYIESTDSVTIVPKRPFVLTKPIQLRVAGLSPLGLTDMLGRLIDGNHDGQPGGDAVINITKKSVTILAKSQTRATAVATVDRAIHDMTLSSALLRRGRK
jgi:hypothetical protein